MEPALIYKIYQILKTYAELNLNYFKINIDRSCMITMAKKNNNIAYNLLQHERTKHIKIHRYFITEKLGEDLVCMPHVAEEIGRAHV